MPIGACPTFLDGHCNTTSNSTMNWTEAIDTTPAAQPEDNIHTVSFYVIIAGGIILSSLTLIGNIMVMLSFKIDRGLQTVTNYFLFSLAVADLSIAVISIPFMTYYTAVGSWNIGYTLCQFWLCMDYLMSNSSVMNLLLISVDRYLSVTYPLTYRPKRTKKRALMMIAATYIVSALLWPPWIVGWPYIDGKFVEPDGSCYIQFLDTNPYISVITACCAYYIPVSVMTILYVRVYMIAKKRNKVFGTNGDSRKIPHETKRKVTGAETGGEIAVSKKRSIASPENKAARTLFAITFAFFITWLPYDAIVIWEQFYPHTTPAWLWSFGYALCYVNSTLNPVCYALGNPKYRATYMKIIKCQWNKENEKRKQSEKTDWRRSTIDEKL